MSEVKVMKKLFTGKTGSVSYVGAHAVIGGSQFRLVDVDASEIQHQLAKNSIDSLDFEFPDEATHIEFQKYLRAFKGDVRAAAEAYLADLKSGKSENLATADVQNASENAKKVGEPKVDPSPIPQPEVEPKKTKATKAKENDSE